MHYKTMVLGLLEQRPQLYQKLRNERMLLAMLNRYASDLKTRHKAWKVELLRARSQSDPAQIASEALELALQEFEDLLPSESPAEADGPESPEAVVDPANPHTPTG